MGSIDYKKLYFLQDEVLKAVFDAEHEFYLTGGTCLSRFYVEKRYSDDCVPRKLITTDNSGGLSYSYAA